ncbi:MAG TPA: 4-(cytidine 5'-diphospho)-2-C-methyl-D-erythritol kinase, partial [Longimicrobiales bacterium]|nr:4-(cytidine 5'-diphospho)-2-C-methyl-D-erythritol kinase [Longimicrobiales bacterium]
MTAFRACLVRAPAKVNLYLEVGGLRNDGFHDVDTLFQAVSLWDQVRVERVASGVSLTVLGPDLGPADDNLAVRAARLFLDEVVSREGVALELTKGIPAGAGLGGGSSDAAAVLRGMNHLWDRPVSPRRLAGMAASL